jgi:hypothetical protein
MKTKDFKMILLKQLFGLTSHQYKPLTEGVLFLCLWNILKESFPFSVVGKNHYKYANIKTKTKISNVQNIFRYGTEHLLFTPSTDKDRSPATYNSLFCIVQ